MLDLDINDLDIKFYFNFDSETKILHLRRYNPGGWTKYEYTDLFGGIYRLDQDAADYTEYIVCDEYITLPEASHEIFAKFKSLKEVDFDNKVDFSYVTRLDLLFDKCVSLTHVNFSGNSTIQNKADVRYMFRGCSSLREVTLNLSDVKYMGHMFENCTSLVSFSFGDSFNMKNVYDTSAMFSGCTSLVTLDLTKFDVYDAASTAYMFENCTSLKYIDISTWIFNGNIVSIKKMFSGCTSLEKIFAKDWRAFVSSEGTDCEDLFYNCINLPNFDPNVVDIRAAHDKDDGEIPSGYFTEINPTIKTYYRNEPVTEGSSDIIVYLRGEPFSSRYKEYTGGYLSGAIEKQNNIKNVIVESPCMLPENCSGMFRGCQRLYEIDCSKFLTQNVTDMSYMFYNCNILRSIDMSAWITSNVTNMMCMFQYCTMLGELGYILDISHFNMSNVTSINSMFSGCNNLTHINMSNLDLKKVLDMSWAFGECLNASIINIKNTISNDVTNMSSMFAGCKAVETLDLGGFNTANVTTMSNTFSLCNALKSINISSFNTSNVTDFSSMFNSCSSLEELDVSKFVTSKATTMYNMFYGCKLLEELDVSKFNVSSVSNFTNMFYECTALIELDLTNFNVNHMAVCRDMFAHCSNLKLIKANNWSLRQYMSEGMFRDCFKLPNYHGNHINDACAHDCNDDTVPCGYFNSRKYKIARGTTLIKDANRVYRNGIELTTVYKNRKLFWHMLWRT